jgi:hypothetical protein
MNRTRRIHLAPRLRGAALALAALLTTTAVASAQGAWSPDFDVPGFGYARVQALGTFQNELIAGLTDPAWRDGQSLQHVARHDGVRWQPIGSGVNGSVRTAIEFQGQLWIGGFFGLAGATPANCVARWNGTQWQAVGQGFNDEVFVLCEHQGQLYAGGSFVASGAATVRSLARWNGAQWLEVGGGVRRTGWSNTTVRTLLSRGASLVVGGDFDTAGTTPVQLVASWNGTSWNSLGGGVDGAQVDCLADFGGDLFCGGWITQAGSTAVDGIARWNGSVWAPVGLGVQSPWSSGGVHAMCVFQNQLYVGGTFVWSGPVAMRGIARYDGTNLLPLGGVGSTSGTQPAIRAMTVWGSRLWCGGDFETIAQWLLPDEELAAFHIASFDGAFWDNAGDGLGFEDEVMLFGTWQGQAVACGRFGTAGGTAAGVIARFDGQDWRRFGTFDGLIGGMTEHNGELWVAGQFWKVNGVVADGCARFDGTTWHAVPGLGPWRADSIASYQGQIHVGTTGSPKRWNGSMWQTFTPAISGILTQMCVHNGVLYMGGSTPFHAGAPNLFAWNGSVLSVPGGGVNNSVEALTSVNGQLLVGGRFTTAGGLAARCIAAWDGSSWSTFGSGIQGATVSAITSFRGEVVIGGDFNTFQGAPADYVARWTGAGWARLVQNQQPQGFVGALHADDARGELLVGGWFFRIGTADAGYVGAFEPTPFWTPGGGELGNGRRAPHLRGDGRLHAGTPVRWQLSSANETSLGVLVLGTTTVNVPVFGGVLIPSPDATALLATDDVGVAPFAILWPGPLSGIEVHAQAWVLDAGGPEGLTASNVVVLRTP